MTIIEKIIKSYEKIDNLLYLNGKPVITIKEVQKGIPWYEEEPQRSKHLNALIKINDKI